MKTYALGTLALLFTAGTAFAQSNDASINQIGNDNEAAVQQVYQVGGSGDDNEAFVTQTGDENTVGSLNQQGAGNWYEIVQSGNQNIVERYPNQGSAKGGSYDGYIFISQTGDKNKVWDADQAGSGNSIEIYQDGRDIVNIEGQVSLEGGIGNSITINQFGGKNAVGVYSAKGSGAYQEGEANSMDITQEGGAKAGISSVYVSGATETFFKGLEEGGQGLVQLGDDNILTINQDGASIVEFVIQKGNMNTSMIEQTGDLHNASVSQVGDSNSAVITQSSL